MLPVQPGASVGRPAITAILLDLDDTLTDDRHAMAQAALQLRRAHQLAAQHDDAVVTQRWDSIGRSLWAELAAGRTTLLAQRRDRLRRTFDAELADDQADRLFDEYLGYYEQHWTVLPGTVAFLNRTAHLPRALVTNGRRALVLRKLRKLSLEPHFQAVVTPEDCGHSKPDARIFLHALRLLGAEPARCLMVGDNLAADIAPAEALGMQVFHVCREQGRAIEHAA